MITQFSKCIDFDLMRIKFQSSEKSVKKGTPYSTLRSPIIFIQHFFFYLKKHDLIYTFNTTSAITRNHLKCIIILNLWIALNLRNAKMNESMTSKREQKQ